jgi:hypothetical protein
VEGIRAVLPFMIAKNLRPAAPVKLKTLAYDYDVPGALTPEQRSDRLKGLSRVLLDIFLSLTPEQRAEYAAVKG